MVRKVLEKLFGKKVDSSQDIWYNNNIKRKGEILAMEKLAQVLASYAGKKFTVRNGKINQLERNAFKADFVSALAQDLESAGLTVGSVDKGFAVLVDNDELGSIAIVLDGVVKGLDYDFEDEVNAEALRQAEKAEKLAKLKAKKEATA